MKLSLLRSLSLLLAAGAVMSPSLHAQNNYLLNPNAADARVVNPNNGGAITIQDQTNYAARIGEQNAPGGAAYVIPFALPTLAPGDTTFTAASLRFQLFAIVGNGTGGNLGNADLYALNRSPSTSPQPLTSDYYQGTGDSANTLLQSNFLTPNSPLRTDANNGPFITTSAAGNTALVNFLNQVDPGGANAGQYVFLRVSYDLDPIPGGNSAYTLLTQDAGGANEKPLLTLTSGVGGAVPEPTTVFGGLLMLGAFGWTMRRQLRGLLAA